MIRIHKTERGLAKLKPGDWTFVHCDKPSFRSFAGKFVALDGDKVRLDDSTVEIAIPLDQIDYMFRSPRGKSPR